MIYGGNRSYPHLNSHRENDEEWDKRLVPFINSNNFLGSHQYLK